MSDTTARSPRRVKRLAFGVVAVPLLLIAMAGGANAAELAPVAEYLDGVVADLDADVISIVTALFS